MTASKFFVYSFLQWVLLTLVKVAYFNGHLISGEPGIYFYFALTAIVTTAMVRRLGILNLLEALLIAILWFFGDLLSDAIITVYFTGSQIFSIRALWFGYLIMIIFIFVFHKKRHIHVRKELHEKAKAAQHH